MTSTVITRTGGLAVVFALCAGVSVVAGAQVRGRDPGTARIPPGEALRLLDAYAVVQAQEMLQLTDEQYPRFVQRFKHLQDLRRQRQQARGRLLQELQQLTRPEASAPEEATLKRKLAELAEHDATTRQEIERAATGIDEVLTLRQQARFRVFEEQIERRKLERMSRARQAARPAARRALPQ